LSQRVLALPQGMLGREACVYVRASSAMLGRAGLMVRQVGPARNRCACASLSRAASHTSGAYPFVLSRRAVRVVRCFARKLIEEVEEYPVFPHVMTSKSPFAKLGIKLPSPGTRLRSVRWRSVSSGRSCQDRATVHYSPCRWYVLDVITSAAAARNFARSCNTQERLAGVPPSWSAAAAVSQASRTTSRDLRVSSQE
jgi:hypothetical protein